MLRAIVFNKVLSSVFEDSYRKQCNIAHNCFKGHENSQVFEIWGMPETSLCSMTTTECRSFGLGLA